MELEQKISQLLLSDSLLTDELVDQYFTVAEKNTKEYIFFLIQSGFIKTALKQIQESIKNSKPFAFPCLLSLLNDYSQHIDNSSVKIILEYIKNLLTGLQTIKSDNTIT